MTPPKKQKRPPSEAEKQQFLAVIALGVSVVQACKCSGHVRSTWWKLSKEDELFGIEYRKAIAESGKYETMLAGAIYKRILLEIQAGKNFWPAIRFACANFKLGFIDPEVTVKRDVNIDKAEIAAESKAYRKTLDAGRISRIEDAQEAGNTADSKLA